MSELELQKIIDLLGDNNQPLPEIHHTRDAKTCTFIATYVSARLQVEILRELKKLNKALDASP